MNFDLDWKLDEL